MSNRQKPATIFVPPGAGLMVSPGVEVVPMVAAQPQAQSGELLALKQQREQTRDADRRSARDSGQKAAKAPGKAGSQGGAPRQANPAVPQTAQATPGARYTSESRAAKRSSPFQVSWQLPATWMDLIAPEGAGGILDDSHVPPEVEAAAKEVMGLYDMQVSGMQLITAKPDKGGAIWRIETNHGPRSIKLLHRASARSLFSIGAQEYLVDKGARVPPLIPTRSGDLSVELQGKRWIVTEWVEPLIQATKVDLEGAAALCYGLGEFHRLSQGYVPPVGAQNASRVYRWPKAYQKVLTKIGWFREIAQAYPEMPASSAVLSVVDMFEQQARNAIARLQASPYAGLVARGEQAWGLVHQDD